VLLPGSGHFPETPGGSTHSTLSPAPPAPSPRPLPPAAVPGLLPASYELQPGSPATPSRAVKLQPGEDRVQQQAIPRRELLSTITSCCQQLLCALRSIPVR